MNYKIIITKDRKHFRHIKTFTNKNNVINYYRNIIKENEKVKFEKQFIRYKPCKFHIEVLSPFKFSDTIEWEKNDLGKNIPAPERDGMFIWRLKEWKEPESFCIYGLPGRYDYNFLIDLIKKSKEIIGMSTIQNLLILDLEGRPLIITLKNIPDAKRLYKVIISENLKNILAFGVMSKKNRKGFYKLAESMGIPTEMFYTKSTRW
jgi:hypothetical protein